MVEVGLVFLGLFAGILSGIFGIGGGILIVPILLLVFKMDMPSASACSLAALLPPVTLPAVLQYYKAGLVQWKPIIWICMGLFFGSFLGAEISFLLESKFLYLGYILFLTYICLRYWGLFTFFAQKQKIVSPQQEAGVVKLIVIGILAGIIAGLFGKGGGIVLVPLLNTALGYSYPKAVATSLAALLPPIGLPALFVYAENGSLNLYLAIWIALGLIIGSFFGTRIALKIPSASFKKMYALFLLFIILYLIFHL